MIRDPSEPLLRIRRRMGIRPGAVCRLYAPGPPGPDAEPGSTPAGGGAESMRSRRCTPKGRAAACEAGPLRALVPALALLAVSLAGPPDAAADQRDPRLPELFAALAEAPDPAQALPIEGAIWGIWLDGGDPALDELMARGVEAMRASRLRDAAERFTELILAAPEFAEAWNKRATVYYLMDRYEDSVRDIERTLALEPRHFGAISGMGLIFLARGDEEGALGAFEKVLEIHPRAPGARFHVERLRERLEGRRI